jgi:hypothetical protein
MKAIKKQDIDPIGEFQYQVVVTHAKYGNSKELTASFHFNDYEQALDAYQAKIAERAAHLSLVDTSAIVGLYRGQELRKQIVLKSVC